MSDLRPVLDRLLQGMSLDEAAAADLLRGLTHPDLPPAMAGALLTALRMKGETAEEVRGFATAMRELAVPVALPAGIGAADVVGTGGDSSGSFNLSTGGALLAAACGVPVVKHGNRSVSSRSGSADLLETLGVPIAGNATEARDCLEACGFAFLFAPNFHPAMKAVAPVRRAMGARTVFNLLGPLTNPAAPSYGVLGAWGIDTARLMADALSGMPITRYFVIHGEPGWDEATPVGPFTLFDVTPGKVRRVKRDPQDAGLPRCRVEDLIGGTPADNARALEAVLGGRDSGPHAHALALGAGLVLEVTGRVRGLRRGVEQARGALEAGAGLALLRSLRAFSTRSA